MEANRGGVKAQAWPTECLAENHNPLPKSLQTAEVLGRLLAKDNWRECGKASGPVLFRGFRNGVLEIAQRMAIAHMGQPLVSSPFGSVCGIGQVHR